MPEELQRQRSSISGALLILGVLIATVLVADTAFAGNCGDPGERACCVFEPPTGGGCVSGAIEVPQANSGLCNDGNIFGIQSSGICVAATACGGPNQRACCLFEASFGACRAGLIEQPAANSGYCSNSSSGIQSSGICRVITACGGEGERACCVGEAGFGACESGLTEIPQANSGLCGGSILGIQSSGICEALTPCGGLGERACCLFEAGFGACESGLVEVPQANSGQCSNLAPGIQSSGACEAITSCGGEGERACCLFEASFGACESGLVEVAQTNSGQCGNLAPGVQSSGICQTSTPCGREGQRACCLGEASFGACRSGLNEHPQSNSGQCGNLGLGIQSSGVCELASAMGEACGPLYQCAEGLFCDPLAGFSCVASGGIDEACGPLVPCSAGLQCSLALRCSEEPSQVGQTCDVTAPCADGLFCQAGLPQRCRELKRPGEGCSAFNPCIEGASCDPCLVEGCNAPLQCNWNNNNGLVTEQVCRSLYSADLQAAARDTGLTMIYAVGNEIAAIVGESQSVGVSYGQDGRYGCFTTLCGGLNADVSVETFATIGFYDDFDSVGGSSFANFQEVEILGILNFGTSQIFPRVGGVPSATLIGTEDSFGLGISPDLLPFSAGSFFCETVLDTVMIVPSMDDLPEVPLGPASVVANSGLRVDLSGWACSDTDLCQWSSDDAYDLPNSGSAEISSPVTSGDGDVAMVGAACVSIMPGENYELSAQAKTLGALPGTVQAVWFGGLECDDGIVRIDELDSAPADDLWRPVSAVRTAPMTAQSVSVEITAERDAMSGAASTSRLDVVMVSATTAAAPSANPNAGGGGGGGACGLVGLEPLLVLGLVRLSVFRRRAVPNPLRQRP